MMCITASGLLSVDGVAAADREKRGCNSSSPHYGSYHPSKLKAD